MDRQTIADTFKSIRKRKGLSQQDVADRMGTSKSEVSRLERNERPQLSIERIEEWASALSVDVELLVYDGPPDAIRRATKDVKLSPEKLGAVRRLASAYMSLSPDRIATIDALLVTWERSSQGTQ